MFQINLRLTKFLKDGLAIASGRSVRKKAGVAMFLSPHFQGKISKFLFDSDG